MIAWTGLPQLLVIPFVRYLSRFDSRLLVGTGLVIFATSCSMNLALDPHVAGPQMLVPEVTRAVGRRA